MMTPYPDDALHLTSEWFILPGGEAQVEQALAVLVQAVLSQEPDTLAYLVHRPRAAPSGLQSLPPGSPQSLLFYEIYRNDAAFLRHVNGPVFQAFVAEQGHLFIGAEGRPFTTVAFLSQVNGFVRSAPV